MLVFCCMQKCERDIWFQIIETQAAKHAVSIARTSSADVIACVSGDGIVHEVCWRQHESISATSLLFGYIATESNIFPMPPPLHITFLRL
jgi:hypothetical protein